MPRAAREAGLTISRAFGYGLPVVTSDNLGQQMPEPEALEGGINGVWYRQGDVEHLESRIVEIAQNRDLRRRLSEGAKRTVSSEGGRNMPGMIADFVYAIRAGG